VHNSLMLGAAIISSILFAVAAFFTRAQRRRIVAAFIGGILAALLAVGWDFTGFHSGWWHYTFVNTATAPLLTYFPVVMLYGAAFGLIGWRTVRRFGLAGAIAFYAAYVAFGVSRDHVIASRGDIFVFGSGVQPRIADALAYLSLAVAVQFNMRWLAGPLGGDGLREGRYFKFKQLS
jgi:hypothetical protein